MRHKRPERLSLSEHFKRNIPKILLALTGALPLAASPYPQLKPRPENCVETECVTPCTKSVIRHSLKQVEGSCTSNQNVPQDYCGATEEPKKTSSYPTLNTHRGKIRTIIEESTVNETVEEPTINEAPEEPSIVAPVTPDTVAPVIEDVLKEPIPPIIPFVPLDEVKKPTAYPTLSSPRGKVRSIENNIEEPNKTSSYPSLNKERGKIHIEVIEPTKEIEVDEPLFPDTTFFGPEPIQETPAKSPYPQLKTKELAPAVEREVEPTNSKTSVRQQMRQVQSDFVQKDELSSVEVKQHSVGTSAIPKKNQIQFYEIDDAVVGIKQPNNRSLLVEEDTTPKEPVEPPTTSVTPRSFVNFIPKDPAAQKPKSEEPVEPPKTQPAKKVEPLPPPPPPPPAPVPLQEEPISPSILQAEAVQKEIVKEPLKPEVTPPPNQGFLINFSNVQIAEYIRFISRISNKNFIFNDEDLKFNVTIVSEDPTTIEEIMAALMQVLRIQGLSFMEQGNNILIHRNPDVNSPANIQTQLSKTLPPDAQLVTRVFHLNSFDPAKAADIIKPLLSSQAIIEPLSETSHLILTDLVVNVNKVAELLRSLDQPAQGLVMGQYRAKNVFADALALLAERIIMPLADGKPVQFIPFRETNVIYIISTDFFVEKSIEILQEIDNGARNKSDALSSLVGKELLVNGPNGPITKEELAKLQMQGLAPQTGPQQPAPLWTDGLPLGHVLNTDFSVYRLAYRKGDDIQAALQQIGESMFSLKTVDEGSNSELLNAILSIQWIETSNSLIFSGTRAAIAKLRELIHDLDTPSQQVLIEMLLLETTIDDSLTFGVNFASKFGGLDIGGAQSFLSDGSPLPNAMNQIPAFGPINASTLAQAPGYNMGVIGQNITKDGLAYGSIGALVRAVHDDLNTQVVLNEKILVEDNHSAEVFAGLNVPFRTQSFINSGTTNLNNVITNNFEYRDIGARLIVTPTINSNGIITLEIEQELSTLITSNVILSTIFQNASDAGLTTRKSNSRTTIFVPNRYFVILSGVIQDEEDRQRRNVPCLGGVPVLGAAFSEKRNKGTKRVLMIFIRPTLMSTPEEIRDETKRQQDIWDQKSQQKDMWEYEINETLDFFNINPTNGCNNGCGPVCGP